MTFAVLGTGRGIATVAERLNPGEARLHALLRLAVRPVRRSPRTLRSSVVYRIDSLDVAVLNRIAAQRTGKEHDLVRWRRRSPYTAATTVRLAEQATA